LKRRKKERKRHQQQNIRPPENTVPGGLINVSIAPKRT